MGDIAPFTSPPSSAPGGVQRPPPLDTALSFPISESIGAILIPFNYRSKRSFWHRACCAAALAVAISRELRTTLQIGITLELRLTRQILVSNRSCMGMERPGPLDL